jgi:hypothetical protein
MKNSTYFRTKLEINERETSEVFIRARTILDYSFRQNSSPDFMPRTISP